LGIYGTETETKFHDGKKKKERLGRRFWERKKRDKFLKKFWRKFLGERRRKGRKKRLFFEKN